MRRNSILIFAFSFAAALAAVLPQTQKPQSVQAAETESFITYLPMVAVPDIPAGTQLLKNPSFESINWEDFHQVSSQQPEHWALGWVETGQKIYDDPDIDPATVTPESVHKWDWQLPPHEQIGEPDALILDGSLVYKIFHNNGSFGGELKQTITDLPAGLPVRLTVPILLARRTPENVDPWGEASGVWINGVGNGDGWVWTGNMGHRNWYYHVLDAVVPSSGQLEVVIRVKCRWPTGADFFIDDLSLVVQDH